MRRFKVNEKYAKTYKTVANLDKALIKLKLTDIPHVLVWTESGRCTAVFYGSNGNPAIHFGFCWIM